MIRILILIIAIALIKPSSADCQEVSIERDVLVRVISQLDSFEVLKKLEKEYIAFKDSCIMLNNSHLDYISVQENIILNKDGQIKNLNEAVVEYKNLVEVSDRLANSYKEKHKVAKRNNIISLVSGGAFTIGLTTALLIVLL